MTSSPSDIRTRFIEAAGHVTQSLGLGKILGQIYAHIYFSEGPKSLDDLVTELGISKGSASMAVRQLESWTALRKVWVKGDRKDYFEATDDFGRIIRRVMKDVVGEKMESFETLLDDAEAVLGQAKPGKGEDFVRARVERLRLFRDRTKYMWESPLVQLLMKK